MQCAAPTRTITTERIAGRKLQMKRIAMAVCANADGTSEIPLLFVGLTPQSRSFQMQPPPAQQLGEQYENSAKGWMKATVFERWIAAFNDHMKAEDRHVLLLVVNVSSRRLGSPLSHVKLRVLPPNTTSHLKPQDASIISTFLANVARGQHSYVVDKFDELLESVSEQGEEVSERVTDALFTIGVLVAMRWALEAWEQVTSTTIFHRWRLTQVLYENLYELVEKFSKLRAGTRSMRDLIN